MSDSKIPQEPNTTPGPSVRRTGSIETLPQYVSAEDDHRRSLEDASMPLPPGWLCHLDAHSNHHYYVDMNSTPPRSVWYHPRHEVSPPPIDRASIMSSKRTSFFGKLKGKMIVSKADLEAERQQKEAKERELLSRYAKRREEVISELEKDGGKTRFGSGEYVGPPASPYGGEYRALMPARGRGINDNLAGWLA
ncbi:WW/Rsp5/WWP protein, partial [Favolaschia claudopus]